MGAGPVPAFTIAGVAGDVRETTLGTIPMEIVYIPVIGPTWSMIIPTKMSLVIRTQVRARAGGVRETISRWIPA